MLGGAESGAKLGNDTINETRQRVYDRVLEYLCFEGHYNQDTIEFNESNVTTTWFYIRWVQYYLSP